jgi:tRNA nucleotidyltransferase/poly(A) polymerase
MAETFTIRAHRKVMSRLEDKGFEAYLVGGSVRDQVLHRSVKDYDVTTNALPEQVAAIFNQTIPVGAKFGVTVVMVDGEQIEVATYRADGNYSDGRRPDFVSYGKSAKEDVERRDFTMNGLLMDNFGNVIDHVGGLEDIEHRVIRCIGDPNVRFAEDALRMLRAVRFAAQLGFKIDTETAKAIERNAALMKAISHERVAMELFKIVSSPDPLKGLMLLVSTGLYRYCLPEEYADKTNLVYQIQRFSNFKADKDPMMGMAMLFADVEPQADFRLANYLKFSNEQMRELVGMNALVQTFEMHLNGQGAKLDEAGLKRVCRRQGLEFALEIMTQNEFMGKTNFGEKLEALLSKIRAYKPEDIKPQPLITGKDLIDMGLTPGAIFTDILYEVETGQLNGTLTRESALAMIQRRIYRDTGVPTYELRGIDGAL